MIFVVNLIYGDFMEKHVFKKKYGQNFLIDKNIVNKIVNSFEILPDSLVIEIGCGDGRLTSELCKKFDFVLGYEIDFDIKDKLINNLSFFDNFEIMMIKVVIIGLF